MDGPYYPIYGRSTSNHNASRRGIPPHLHGYDRKGDSP